ncbi:MAG TPA: methylated-DNA--[protein]-cysteine S-methyltransferase [Symbiobacteriaceae bacterium]|jgi:O-6-methylguanine DNA methyltransferase
MSIRYTTVPLAPLGPVHVAWTEAGLARLTANGDAESFRDGLAGHYGPSFVIRDDSRQAEWRALLADWLAGREPAIGLDLSGVSPFERKVLAKTREIPRGEVRPYQWLAREAGSPGAVRAVGSAMRKNPIPLLVPCHRVVTATGALGNYSMGGPDVKRRLLEAEGAAVARLEDLADRGCRYLGDAARGTFCYPSCLSAKPGPDRLKLKTAREAEAAGLKPCPHCRPV